MRLELRPYVHFDAAEQHTIDTARRALYTCNNRGPSILNRLADSLCVGSVMVLPRVQEAAEGYRFELEAWEHYLADRKANWAEHPQWAGSPQFRGSEPADYERVVVALRAAVDLLDEALALHQEPVHSDGSAHHAD